MHWIIQENVFEENNFDSLIDSLKENSIPYSIHKVIPFVGELLPDINPEGTVICFGAYSLRNIAQKRNWFPGVYDLEPFDFPAQLIMWGDLMLNADSFIDKFSEITITEDSFIRPITDSKAFAGFVISPENLVKWQKEIQSLGDDNSFSTVDSNTLVQVCSVKNILTEWRYWIVDGKIVTKCEYKHRNKVKYISYVDPEVDEFVQKCIDIWNPLPAFVIDVCWCNDEYKIVEINTINSAGFYAGDMNKLVLALESINK